MSNQKLSPIELEYALSTGTWAERLPLLRAANEEFRSRGMQELKAEDERRQYLRARGEDRIMQIISRAVLSDEDKAAINHVINRSFHATSNIV